MLEMEVCRYMFQNHTSGMWTMVKKGKVSLKAGRPVRSLLPNPTKDGGSSTGNRGGKDRIT